MWTEFKQPPFFAIRQAKDSVFNGNFSKAVEAENVNAKNACMIENFKGITTTQRTPQKNFGGVVQKQKQENKTKRRKQKMNIY